MKKSRARLLKIGLSGKRFLVSFLIPLLLLLGLVYLLVAFYAVYTVVHPTTSSETVDPATYFLKFNSFIYRTKDQLTLPGWYIPAAPDSPIILLCHGIGENRARLLSLADKLHSAGFSVVLPLFRGHARGPESGAYTYGWLEGEDLNALLQEMKNQKQLTNQPLGAWGINSSAFLLLRASVQGTSFRALVLDSPYISIEDGLMSRLSQYTADKKVFLPSFSMRLLSCLLFFSPLVPPPALPQQAEKSFPAMMLVVHPLESAPVQKALHYLTPLSGTQIKKLQSTRQEELAGPEKDLYDQEVVQFFQKISWK